MYWVLVGNRERKFLRVGFSFLVSMTDFYAKMMLLFQDKSGYFESCKINGDWKLFMSSVIGWMLGIVVGCWWCIGS